MSFLEEPAATSAVTALYDEDIADLGYVMNASRVWGHQPEVVAGLFGLMGQVVKATGLTFRQRAILVAACASAFGDSYCSLAWGSKLAGAADPPTAAGVLRGGDEGLTEVEHAMATWARAVARDPNRTTSADVRALRDVGFTDPQILGITTFVALRIAFSTVNDALGAHPDAEMRATVPADVLAAVTFGRPIEPVA